MVSRQKLDGSVLIASVALTRFFFRSHYLYDLDSVNFALALGRFDPAVHQPHPPGYFLYVCLGRLLNAFFHDPNAALVSISIAASCGAAMMIYLLTDVWFGTKAARFAGVLFVASPLAWFHGIVALTYIVEAFFSALTGYLCWRIYEGATRWIVPCALVLGLAAGVRPSSLLFLGPLFLFSIRKAPPGKIVAGGGVLIVTVLAWFVPMIYASGGPKAYFAALSFLWGMAPGRQNTTASFLLLSVVRFCTIAGIFMLGFGSAIALFARTLWTRAVARPQQQSFTWIWISPALLFFTFVFLKFVNSGYLLVIFPPLCAWVAGWAADWYDGLRFPAGGKIALIAVAAAINVALFLQAPFYCSYHEMRHFEAELEAIQRALPEVAAPGHAVIVAFDSHFLGFRHAGYYFPEYRVVEYPEVRFPNRKRVFAMQGRDTWLLDHIATEGLATFVLFPLPQAGDEFRQHSEQMRALFPEPPATITREGFEFITGPIAKLPLLFPVTAKPVDPVSTAGDFAGGPVYKR